MRLFSRRRKVIQGTVLLTLVVVIYLQTDQRRFTKRKNVECVNASCSSDHTIAKLQQGIGPSFGAKEVPSSHSSQSDKSTVVSWPVRPKVVVYNRVPKCASSTVRYLIKRLQTRLQFTYEIHNWPNVKQSLTEKEESELVAEIASLKTPALFLRHLHFVDFRRYGVNDLVYINVIRNPVDRFISHYYFSRFGFVGWKKDKIEKWLWPMTEERRNMTLDDCVKEGATKCVEDNKENMLQFFCGQHERCKKRDDWSLQRAKENIVGNYLFIGVLEELEQSLQILEVLLPQYFRDALENYKHSGKTATKTANKKDPSPETRAELEKAMWREMDLYYFVKERFLLQYENLKSSGYVQ